VAGEVSEGPSPLPGAVGISHLRVYDSEAPDGLRGGTPHLHTVCTEAYVVIDGEGAVQTLAADGFNETRIGKGSLVWFTPGTVHRLINDGDLEIFVLMQNSGLPEAGDLVITFDDEVLADPQRYATFAALAPPTERRDAGVEGFLKWKALCGSDNEEGLDRLYRRAAALVSPRVGEWQQRWSSGALATTQATGVQLDALRAGHVGHLFESGVFESTFDVPERRLGCCGTLGVPVA
jgi:mannose-6-phosphate isomerase-like protein (cupin superfamily)